MADPMLTGAIITFQTNDDDKDDDTILDVVVYLRDGKTAVAQTNPGQPFAKFGNNSEMDLSLWRCSIPLPGSSSKRDMWRSVLGRTGMTRGGSTSYLT